MDNYFRDRFRFLGVLAIIVCLIAFLVLSFASSKEKYKTALVLKTFNADIIQAILNSKNDNGNPGDWGWTLNANSSRVVTKKFFKYLNVSKFCSEFSYDCFPVNGYTSLNKKQSKINPSIFPSVELNNGITISVQSKGSCRKYNSVCALVYVDINGINKPNVLGKDLFVFTIINNDTYAFVPYNNDLSASMLKNDLIYGCNNNSEDAMNCAAIISKNNWKIDSDYPW